MQSSPSEQDTDTAVNAVVDSSGTHLRHGPLGPGSSCLKQTPLTWHVVTATVLRHPSGRHSSRVQTLPSSQAELSGMWRIASATSSQRSSVQFTPSSTIGGEPDRHPSRASQLSAPSQNNPLSQAIDWDSHPAASLHSHGGSAAVDPHRRSPLQAPCWFVEAHSVNAAWAMARGLQPHTPEVGKQIWPPSKSASQDCPDGH